ncbi:sulfatase-like hydrolase/transferase [Bordetella bronchiseptica]|uniref:sulfatase-like hydrolase/transferase n=1 Tax=Bordetella bronchiseptica TaxID=518 RepID=UPI0002901225|nr:sulfatase-like hydrolase/transferase [Bordetella bronchiseptica]KAK71498.1 type I phosphodiesterase/nucleotide pyrophosphatase [Bordetella bronchiseptica MO211]CCN18394.1 probable sulfatase [Bordetella bronchiseptica MO211]
MSQPNFLLFITDQHRADHLGAYGNPQIRTPALDALARRGWLAERFYVASPICMPNRATLMTGRMPSAHGARHNGIPLSQRATTFVERLRQAGYGTALVGKSHLQNMTGNGPVWPRPQDPPAEGEAWAPEPGDYDQEWGPLWREDPAHDLATPFYGFSQVDLAVDHGDQVWGHYWRWLQREHPEVAAQAGPDHALPAPGFELVRAGQAWRTRVPESCSTTAYLGRRTMQALDGYAQRGQPFFIQCSFPDPHHPFTPPGKYWDMYRPEDVELPASFHASAAAGRQPPPHVQWMYAQRDSGRAVKHTPAMFACTEREAREAIALNYGSISHIDHTVGEVLAHLQRLGLADNTVVIFTSDHGDYLGDHQLLWKGPVHYQSVIRTPFIWADPAGAQGARSDALCSTIDIAPTVLARAGLLPYNGIQGADLGALMRGEQTAPREAVLIEEEGQRVMFGFDKRVRMRTLQTGRYRMSVYHGVSWGELYDLREDPLELRNLWDEPGSAALRQDLLFQLAQNLIGHGETSPHPTALA